MHVIDLNDFLRRAQKAGILSSIVLDFTSSTYRMGSGVLTISGMAYGNNGVRLLDNTGRSYSWGMDFEAGSAEIVDLRKVSSRHFRKGPNILLKLGKKCNGRGEVR